MKSILLFTAALLCGNLLCGQTPGQSGVITYEEKIKLEIHLEGDMPALMDSLPKERKTTKMLTFSKGASLYEKDGRKAEEQAVEEGGMRIMMVEPEEIVFSDLEQMTTTEQREFMSRMFLISTDLRRHTWKLTGKQKTVAGYPCQEAVYADTAIKAVAWFCPQIPVSSGPGGFGNLPGMILELNFDNGDRIITAKKVEINEVQQNQLKKPTKGKKVSREEFKAIVAEKMKEMGAEGGEGGQQMIIRIQR